MSSGQAGAKSTLTGSGQAGASSQLAVDAAFVGVNYLESLREVSTGFDQLNGLLTDEKNGIFPYTDSIFNKFAVFQYAGLNAGASYRVEGHFIGFSSSIKTDDTYLTDSDKKMQFKEAALKQSLKEAKTDEGKRSYQDRLNKLGDSSAVIQDRANNFHKNSSSVLSNPTARNIIDWGGNVSGGTPVGFQPYSMTDFMFCKYYGRIPNNRLITLRRYPYPIDDTLKLPGGTRRNAIPVAQAVTWFGGDTGNTLGALGVFSWDMPWKSLAVNDIQDINGTEVTVSQLTQLVAGIKGGETIAASINTAIAAIQGSDKAVQQISGYDQKIQQYQKDLYNTTGPYWNRIYGPVNVINKTMHRDRGIQNENWNNTFQLNFHYEFRSFAGLSPKIAALDLISNFMNLTYNDAQFLGQLARYWPKTGLKFDDTTTKAIGELLTNWGSSTVGGSSTELLKLMEGMQKLLNTAASKIQTDVTGIAKDAVQMLVMDEKRLGGAIPPLISVKSALSDRPVGEWHMVVGNPMNPIFVMGDLIVSSVKMVWNEEIGPDDFPTGVKFEVTLRQGKPRDKVAIERMMNLGEAKLTSSRIKTSSEEDTFGEQNNKNWNALESSATTPKNLENIYNSYKEGSKKSYDRFRNRINKSYGLPATAEGQFTNSTSKVDDTILLMYYTRNYGQN